MYWIPLPPPQLRVNLISVFQGWSDDRQGFLCNILQTKTHIDFGEKEDLELVRTSDASSLLCMLANNLMLESEQHQEARFDCPVLFKSLSSQLSYFKNKIPLVVKVWPKVYRRDLLHILFKVFHSLVLKDIYDDVHCKRPSCIWRSHRYLCSKREIQKHSSTTYHACFWSTYFI